MGVIIHYQLCVLCYFREQKLLSFCEIQNNSNPDAFTLTVSYLKVLLMLQFHKILKLNFCNQPSHPNKICAEYCIKLTQKLSRKFFYTFRTTILQNIYRQLYWMHCWFNSKVKKKKLTDKIIHFNSLLNYFWGNSFSNSLMIIILVWFLLSQKNLPKTFKAVLHFLHITPR